MAAAAQPVRKTVSRDQVAALVDKFLSARVPDELPESKPVPASPEPSAQPISESPVRTIIHELRPQSLTDNGFHADPVDFVSETDVREAIGKGKKIYITAKTILTPSARDLGEEKDVFARI
jgi:hypothetical protein